MLTAAVDEEGLIDSHEKLIRLGRSTSGNIQRSVEVLCI